VAQADIRPISLKPEYMLMLSSELVNEGSPLHVRNAAGLALKNALTARVRNMPPLKSGTSFLTLSPLRRVHGKPNFRPDGWL
jgi:hypothetical protein